MAYIGRKDKKWRVRWRGLDGKQQHERTCPTRKAALQLRRQVEEALALGHDWEPEGLREEPPVPTVREAFEQFLTAKAPDYADLTTKQYAETADVFLRFLVEALDVV